VERIFSVKPEWKTAWIESFWGWDSAGKWNNGTYTVDLFIDGSKAATKKLQYFLKKLKSRSRREFK